MKGLRLLCFALLMLPAAAPAGAQSLENLLPETVESHDRVLAAKAEVEAARERASEALGEWYPTLTPSANYGWESQEKHDAANTSTAFKEFDLKLSQLLWDFGSTDASVEKARLAFERAKLSLEATRQTLILEAAKAYSNLSRAREVLDYARQSEENIRRQTGLEQARIESGAGLETDVLQAKRELSAAEARRIEAEGGVVAAENRFLAVFGFVPEPDGELTEVAVDALPLPESLPGALRAAHEGNPDLLLARIDADEAREGIRQARADSFLPTIEGTVERKWKNNVGGTLEYKGETLAKVEMSVPLNLGMTGLNTLAAARADVVALDRTTADTRRTVEEEVRNAWQQLNTARAKARALRNQADIAAAFLDLARQERAIGQRSLIDVLAGETALINARSDAASAETDVLIAAIDLLDSMGRLDYPVFGEAAVDRPAGAEAPDPARVERRRHLMPGEEEDDGAPLTLPPKALRMPVAEPDAPLPKPGRGEDTVTTASVGPARKPSPEPQPASEPEPEAEPEAEPASDPAAGIRIERAERSGGFGLDFGLGDLTDGVGEALGSVGRFLEELEPEAGKNQQAGRPPWMD